MPNKIAVLIDAKLHNELVLRTRKSDDVTHFIEHAVEQWLGNTRDNYDLWSAEYLDEIEELEANADLEKYGDPKGSYLWSFLPLPNATKLKMNYKGRNHFAEIRHGKLMDGNKECSPSEWASKVANHTSRNAWRDIFIQVPGSQDWKLADIMRQELKSRLDLET